MSGSTRALNEAYEGLIEKYQVLLLQSRDVIRASHALRTQSATLCVAAVALRKRVNAIAGERD